jgi:pyruvate/2-oxoglutarate dehydrogenase complex dihydrolipoamide acyltransferase (E2) component
VSGEVSYDVYVKGGVDSMGRDEFSEAVAHFVERRNAVALKRRLVARGETVHVERSVVHGLSEEEKERRFSDYARVPEYEPPRDRTSPQRGPGRSETAAEEPEEQEAAPQSATGGAQEGAQRPWWKRVFGG